MRFPATTVVAFMLLASTSDGFQSSFVPRPAFCSKTTTTTTKTTAAAASVSMLVETSGGMEELTDRLEQTDSSFLAKRVRQSPALFKIAGYASIPVTAALGFGLVPSRRIVAHCAGAVITGIAGAVGQSRLDAWTQNSVEPAVAQVLVDKESAWLTQVDATARDVQAVLDDFGVADEDDRAEIGVSVYSTYLQGMVKYAPTAKTSELTELAALAKVLGLNNVAVGAAHARAAEEWYRVATKTNDEEDLLEGDSGDAEALNKLLFLTERALKDETSEAFRYEMTRVAKALGVDSLAGAMERVAAVVEPFYVRALQSTRAKLDSESISADMLQRARQTLGISEETAKDLHVASFHEEVRACLGLPETFDADVEEGTTTAERSALKFKDDTTDRLDKLREVLDLTETDAYYEVSVEAGPLYQETALAAMKDVLAQNKSPDDAWDVMEQRREELLLPEDASQGLVWSMVMQALGGPLEETNKFSKVNNEAATYDHLLDALEAKKALINILAKSGWNEVDNFDETFCNPWDRQSANGFLTTEDRNKLYRTFLTRSVRKAEDGKLTDEVFEQISQVKGLLGITDQQAEVEARHSFGPELQKALNEATVEITADYTPELVENMRKQVQDIVTAYKLSDDFVRESGAAFYARAVEIVSVKSPGGIPSSDMCSALEALRELFRLTEEDCYPAHMEHFGTVYKKSVAEAMGSTGIIKPDFRTSLDDLRSRLGIAEDNIKTLYLEAVEEKMIPMVKWIGSEMERTMLTQQQLADRRGKDMGEDVFQSGKGADGVLGLGAEVNIMGDIMELVDFYKENDIATEGQIGSETVEVKSVEDGEEVAKTEEVPIMGTIYPITALGCGAIDQEMAEMLYRQLVVSSFTTQGPNAARYEENRAYFAGILGLATDKIEEVNDNIGSTVYDNFVSNAMKTKGTMDQQDMMFLANIQGKLGLTSAQGEKMLMQSQKKILSEEINALMDNSPTPEAIKAFREKCNTMGMDMQADVGVSMPRLTRMFESEVTPGLKSGEITAESADILGEIQESFGIEPEDCETMFEGLLMRLSKSAMDLAQGELLRGRDENAVDLIKEVVRYAAFTGGDLGFNVEEATAHQIANLYDALDFSNEDAEQVQENKELLATAVGI